MFDRFYMIRHKRMDFIVKSAHVECMVWCIWHSTQVQMVMDEFIKDGMKYNPPISWFLTKQTGSNAGAGLGSKLSKLEDRLKLAESTSKEAIKEAKEASKRTATAGTNANAVKLGLGCFMLRTLH
jgi:hypothetical protein